jgi:spore germination protein GerM
MGLIKGVRRCVVMGVILALVAVGGHELSLTAGSMPAGSAMPTAPAPADPGKRVVHLYFADGEQLFLKSEQRVLKAQVEPSARARQIVAALIDGPQNALHRVLPEKTHVRSAYVSPGGTAYIDLSQEAVDHHPGGARREQLTVFAVVNSLVLNMEQVRAVKLLVNGRETDSFAGHLDLRYPFTADMLLVR